MTDPKPIHDEYCEATQDGEPCKCEERADRREEIRTLDVLNRFNRENNSNTTEGQQP